MAKVISGDPGRMGRVPPQNIEAERSVLGAIIQDKEAQFKVLEILSPEHFYSGAHAVIYEAILELFDKKRIPVDLTTVNDCLKEMGKLESIGGPGYIAGLLNVVPTVENAEHYANIVRNKALLRSCIKVADHMSDWCYKEEMHPDEIIDRASSEFLQLAQGMETKDFEPMDELAQQTYNSLPTSEEEAKKRYMQTTFTEFDKDYQGFYPGEYVVIAARPSVGKTSWALNIATGLAERMGKSIAIFSLEMPCEQLAVRMISSLSRVPASDIFAGKVPKSEFKKVQEAASKLKKLRIFVDETASLTPVRIRAKIKRLMMKEKGNIDLVIIDYLQLLDADRSSRGENRVQEVTQMSRSLKALAKEIKRPIIVISQLSRHIERREFKHRAPMLSDLRESGAIEQDADKVIFLHRVSDVQEMNKNNQFEWNEIWYRHEVPDIDGTAREIPVYIYIMKNRNGPTGQMLFGFHKKTMRFTEHYDSSRGGYSHDDGSSKMEDAT